MWRVAKSVAGDAVAEWGVELEIVIIWKIKQVERTVDKEADQISRKTQEIIR